MEIRPKKLLDQVCVAIRVKHYPRKTNQVYIDLAKKCIQIDTLTRCKYQPSSAGDLNAFALQIEAEIFFTAVPIQVLTKVFA